MTVKAGSLRPARRIRVSTSTEAVAKPCASWAASSNFWRAGCPWPLPRCRAAASATPPRVNEASATVVLDGAREQELRSLVTTAEAQMRSKLGAFDPGLRITVEAVARPDRVLADGDASLVAGLLASIHHGVLAMSPDVAGLVQTSTNLATVSTRDGEVEIETSQRSAIESSKLAGRMASTIFRLAGFEMEHARRLPPVGSP